MGPFWLDGRGRGLAAAQGKSPAEPGTGGTGTLRRRDAVPRAVGEAAALAHRCSSAVAAEAAAPVRCSWDDEAMRLDGSASHTTRSSAAYSQQRLPTRAQ
jgi:hypothetical protein